MVKVVENLARSAVQQEGSDPDPSLVAKITDYAQSILNHATESHQADQRLLQETLAAIQVCSSNASHLMVEAESLKDKAKERRVEHEACREGEVGHHHNRSSRCDEYDTYRGTIDNDINDCTGKWFLERNVAIDEHVEPDTVVSMESCLVEWSPWIEELHRLYLACHVARGVHDDTTAACNAIQRDFEHEYCDYAAKLDDHCHHMNHCYEEAVSAQTTTHEHVKSAEEARKHDWVAASRIACYAKVFEIDRSEKLNTLLGCQNEDITTDHLNLSYPATPPAPTCALVEARPCADGWVTVEYSSKVWYTKAPTATCRPCSR